ncbi:helix-turn-helix transcriptional regulator [soil metagenome]
MTSNLPPLPLVARAPETRLIRLLLDNAAASEGGVLIFRGDTGVGKSRLLRLARDDAEQRGWLHAIGRSYPVESGIPYALFADALLPLLKGYTPDELSVLTRGGIDELSYLLPFLPGPHASSRTGNDDPAELRMRLLWKFTELLGALADRNPLLLILDDLQWADASSLELLHFLTRQIGGKRIALLCAYNQEIESQNPQLSAVRQSLTIAGAARIHTVEHLSRSETAQLIHEAFGTDVAATREFSALLFDWTRGNPFFLEEMLKTLVEAGRLGRRDGSWHGWDTRQLDLPQTIREAVLHRFSTLTPAAREQAELLSVVGTSIDHETLLHISGLEGGALIAAIEEMRQGRIVEERVEVETLTYDFTHPILRETLYSGLGVGRARLLHARVAEALETSYGERADEHSGALAYHFARTTGRELPQRAVRYLMLAGCEALDRFANREAADYLALAFERGGECARADLHLLENLARARQRLGQFEEAATLAGRLRSSALVSEDATAIARAERRLGLIAYRSGDHVEALDHFSVAIETARGADDGLLEARLHLVSAECLLELGRSPEAGEQIHAALKIAQERGDKPLLARVRLALLFLHSWTGPPRRAREEGEKVLAMADELDDPALLWTAHWGLTMLAGLAGDPVAAAEHCTASTRLAEQLGSPLHRLRSAELEIELLTNAGDWDGALSLGEQTIEAARALNQRSLLPRILVSTALVHFGRGDLERGKMLVDEAWNLSGAERAEGPLDVHTVVPAYAGRAAYHLWAGEMLEAARVATEGLTVADRTGYTAWSIHRLLPLLAEAYLSMGDVENGARVGARLRHDSQQLGHKLGLAWADIGDAILQWLQGDPSGGTARLREAANRLEAIPAIPDTARLRRYLAARLRDLGEREEALSELRKVHDIFSRLGAERELAKTREQMRELGARPPVREVAAGMQGLSGREVEIAQMVRELKSNKSIARDLGISVRTVSTHLSNVFRKLEIGSRAELVEVMRRNPLTETPSGQEKRGADAPLLSSSPAHPGGDYRGSGPLSSPVFRRISL